MSIHESVIHHASMGDVLRLNAGRYAELDAAFRMRGHYRFLASRGHVLNLKTGRVEWETLWEDEIRNLVPTAGLNAVLGRHFHADTQITTWYMALLAGTPSVNASSTYQNTLSTGNQEVTAYDEAARPTFVEGAPSGGSIDNVGNEAVVTCSTNDTTFGGIALVSDATKNDNGAGPIMHSAGAFSQGNKTIDDGDTLTITLTLTAAAA